MTSRQWRIFELALILSIAFLPSFILSIIHVFTGINRDFSAINYSDYLTWIAQSILSVTLLFYVLYKNGRNYTDIGLSLKFRWSDLLLSVGLILASSIAGGIIINLVKIVSPEFATNATNPQNIGFLKTSSHILLFLFMIIVPVQEELIVRGFAIIEVFKLSENKTLAIILSVGIQFTYHLYQGIAPAILMLPYFIIISVYFVRSGNLNPVIYSHILIDLINFLRLV